MGDNAERNPSFLVPADRFDPLIDRWSRLAAGRSHRYPAALGRFDVHFTSVVRTRFDIVLYDLSAHSTTGRLARRTGGRGRQSGCTRLPMVRFGPRRWGPRSDPDRERATDDTVTRDDVRDLLTRLGRVSRPPSNACHREPTRSTTGQGAVVRPPLDSDGRSTASSLGVRGRNQGLLARSVRPVRTDPSPLRGRPVSIAHAAG